MRIRIIQKPTMASIDGVLIGRFRVGQQYEIGNILGAVFLAEGWAEPVDDPDPALVIPLREFDGTAPINPRNLIREMFPPYYDGLSASALDRRRRPRRRS